jgi:DNA-binding response OmpR family regulator
MKEINANILLVEDDENLGTLLSEYLNSKGYQTTLANDGEKGLRKFLNQSFDICILDVMMPVKDGFTLAKEIREVNTEVPIVFLTAKSMKEDTLEGFTIGADDYITKPFSMDVLLMRIKAILRRFNDGGTSKDRTIFEIGSYNFDSERRVLSKDGKEEKLTSKENDLLKLLAMSDGKTLERKAALMLIWGDDNYFNSRSMDVYITKLRKYLKADEDIEIINIHGKGFKLYIKKDEKK